MIEFRRKALPLLLCVLPALTGCLRTTRSVMQTHAPSQVLSSSLDDLLKGTTSRFDAIQTLKAKVDMTATTGGGKQGKVVEYPSFNGYILLRRPNDFRFLGLLPIAHTTMIDLVSDGKNFTLSIPIKSRGITGTDKATNETTTPDCTAGPSTPSSAPLVTPADARLPRKAMTGPTPAAESNSKCSLENLRPTMFTDSLLIRGAAADELVSMVSDDRIYQPDPTRKYVVDEPEYDIGIYHTVPNSPELKTQRVIHVGRATLLPYQQDIYDAGGQLVTVANYDDYKLFGDTKFPSVITIHRPLDQITLKITITELSINQKFEDDQFDPPKVPDNYQVQHLP